MLISFEKNIVDDVYEKFEGKYTKEQIFDVFDSSVSYIHHLIRYEDAYFVRIPFIGMVAINLPELKIAQYRLTKKHKLKQREVIELENINKKIVYLESNRPSKWRSHPIYKGIKRSIKNLRLGNTFSEVQHNQNSKVF